MKNLRQLSRRTFGRLLTAALLLAWLASGTWARAADDKEAKKGIEGIWEGKLKIMAIELRLIVHVEKSDDGKYKSTLDSPDQGAKGIPIESATLDKNEVRFESKAIKLEYTGTINDDANEIVGRFKQGGLDLDLTFKRVEKEPELRRPQDPVAPFPYEEEEVSYSNADGSVKFAGTLTLPKSETPVAAVLLITGSGSQDRNETLLGHRPFLVLADHLTREGIAVLRVDDRGIGGTTGNTDDATSENFADDALAGVAFLQSRKEIDPKKIGLIGHSEGGLIGPLVASKSRDVAFIVMMAGTGVTGEEIILSQGALIAKAMGASDEDVAKAKKSQVESFDIIRKEKDVEKVQEKLMKLVEEELKAIPDGKEAKTARSAAEAQIKAVTSPWFRFFLTYDPRPALTKVRCPVLAINGELDLQVDPKLNLPEIEKALKSAGNPDFTLHEFPGLNHLFQHCQTGAPSEYGTIEETISPEVLSTISDWINKRMTEK